MPAKLTSKQIARINVAALPEGMRRLVSYLGEELAFNLINELGGQVIKVPKRASEGHVLSDALGIKGMAKLCQVYDGGELVVPKNDKLFIQFRRRRVIELLDKGYTLNQTAAQTGYTKRQVCNIGKMNLEDMAHLQPDMFGFAKTAEIASPELAGAHNPWGYGGDGGANPV